MSSGNPYDGLGRILAGGGERAVALAIDRGASPGKLASIISKKFPGLTGAESSTLTQFGLEMTEAAERINRLSDDASVESVGLPINPFQQGAETDSGRFRWIGEVKFDEADTGIIVYGVSATYPTNNELYEQIVSGGMGIGEQYPGKFGLPSEPDFGVQWVRVIAVSGGF